MAIGRVVAAMAALCLAAATVTTGTATSAKAAAKDDPQLSISYSGSTDETTTWTDPAMGTEKIHIEWDFQVSGPLSKIAGNLGPSGRKVNFVVRNLVGSITHTFPPPNDDLDCADTFSTGPAQRVFPELGDGILDLTAFAPLSTAYNGPGALIIPKAVGRSCVDLSNGVPDTSFGAPPIPANGVNPAAPHFVYDLTSGSKSLTVNEHPTVHQNQQNSHWDFISSLSISGRSCAGLSSRTGCTPQAVALAWARATPVVRDRVAPVFVPGKPPNPLEQTSASYTAACLPGDKISEYVACPEQRPSKLVPSKNWPVVVVGGTHPILRDVTVFIPPAPFPIGGARLEGTATVAGKKLTFKGSDRHGAGKPDLWQFDNVTADGVWPQKVLDLTVTSGHPLAITWQLVIPAGNKRFAAGTTLVDVFVARHLPTDHAGNPYLSLVYPAARDANGAATDVKTFDGMWKAFSKGDRTGLHRYELNPATGQISKGLPLQFWPTGWSLLGDISGQYFAGITCAQNVGALLAIRVATCTGFADYMISMLGQFGIASDKVLPDAPHGFLPAVDSQFFLVNDWVFGSPTPSTAPYYDPSFPYAVGFHFPAPVNGSPGTPSISPAEVSFTSSTGQGNPSPPGMFSTLTVIGTTHFPPYVSAGDHALVSVPIESKKLYDPSYGAGPFIGLGDWAVHSIAGWARLTNAAGANVNIEDCGVKVLDCYLLVRRGV